VKVFVETAQFLVNQGTLPALPERTMFNRAVNTRYLSEALQAQQ
jgi:hypothetical protein